MGQQEKDVRHHSLRSNLVDTSVSLPRDPQVFLASIIQEKRALVASGVFEPFKDGVPGKSFFSKLQESKFFKDVYAQAITVALDIDSVIDEKRFLEKLAGALFEAAAYVCLSARLGKKEQIVLSPQETHTFYKILHPDKKTYVNQFGPSSLLGVYQPDGLAIDPWSMRIKKVLEYKLFNGEEVFQRQLKGFYKHQVINPEFFNGSRFNFITPKDFKREYYHTGKNLDFFQLNLTYGEFGRFVKRIYEAYPFDETHATLSDMLNYRDQRWGKRENSQRRSHFS